MSLTQRMSFDQRRADDRLRRQLRAYEGSADMLAADVETDLEEASPAPVIDPDGQVEHAERFDFMS